MASEPRVGTLSCAEDVTEQHHAEEALRDSERLFRAVFEDAAVGVGLIDAESGRFVQVNQAYCDIAGWSRAEMTARTQADMTHPDDVEALAANAQRLRSGQIGAFRMDKRNVRRDGSVVWASVAVSRLWESRARPRFHVAIIQDITTRKRAEAVMQARLRLMRVAASRSQEQLLQATLDELEALTESRIGFFHIVERDQKTLVLQTWSTRTERELCKAEGQGRHCDVSEAGVWADALRERRAVIHNDYATLPHRKGLPPGHAAVQRELVVPVFRDNLIVALLGVGNKPRDYDGQDLGVVSMFADLAWDIAERKRAESEVRRQKEASESLLASMQDGLSILDVHGVHVDVNPAFCEMTGFSRDELLGVGPPHPYWPLEAREEITSLLDRALRGELGKRGVFELTFMRKNGERFPVLVSPSSLEDETGNVIRYFATIKDISEHKRLESELEKARELESLGVFAAGIAHDFNNLLSVILGGVSFVRESSRPGTSAHEVLAEVDAACRRATDLSQRILTFAEGGAPAPAGRAVQPLIRDTVLASLAGSNVRVDFHLPPDLPPALIDTRQMCQVFGHLATNAREAMPAGGQLRVSAERIDVAGGESPNLPAGGYVSISFADDGEGIAPEHLDKVFDPYFSTRERGVRKGQGLGLTICHSILRRHGGAIKARSLPGRGATFTVFVPVAREVEAAGRAG